MLAAVTFSVRTPTTNPFLMNSKTSDDRNVLQTHINTYFSDGTCGDSQSLVEREPLRSKDRGLLTYNIDIIKMKPIIRSRRRDTRRQGWNGADFISRKHMDGMT